MSETVALSYALRVRFVLVVVFSVLCPLAARCEDDVDRRCPSTALDRWLPTLLGSFDAVKAVVRAEGLSDRFVFRATVTESGTVRQVVVVHPKALEASEKVHTVIGSLRFCPAMRHSRDVSAKVTFEVVTQ